MASYPTTDRLRELFDYSTDGGRLIWKLTKKPAGGLTGRKGARRRQIAVDGTRFLAYRLIWLWHGRELPPKLDHENRDCLDDRIENLRPVTQSENMCNTGLRATNTSGYKGVWWHKRMKRWCVELMLNYKKHVIGYYADLELAGLVSVMAREKYHGQFAAKGIHG